MSPNFRILPNPRDQIGIAGTLALPIWGFAAAVALLAMTSSGPAATIYYVDALNGSDGNSGTSAGAPWRTLQKAANTMGSGDTARVRTGTYRETVVPQNGQRFEAYGSEEPLITGCDPVSGWTVHSGSIYRATVGTTVYDVFVGTNYMQKARYPNEDGDPMTATEWASANCWRVSGSGTGTGKVDFLNGMNKPSGYWVGGSYSGLHGNNHWRPAEGRITASSGSEITCTDLCMPWKDNYASTHLGDGRGYIINHLNCLDTAGEWHWQSGTLYFWAPGGGMPANVQARTRLYGFNLANRQNVTVKGIYFLGAAILVDGGSGNTIDGCHFRHVSPWGNYYNIESRARLGIWKNDGTSGIDISGANHVIRNCSVVGGWGAGIRLTGGNNLTVSNNYVADFGWLCRGRPISGYGDGLYIYSNSLRRASGPGLQLSMFSPNTAIRPVQASDLVRHPSVKYNDVRDTAYLLLDVQCLMYFGNNDAPSQDRRLDGEIAYNVCVKINDWRDIKGGKGIYVDDGTDFVTVHHNVVDLQNTAYGKIGIFFHGAAHLNENVFCYHNTVWGYGYTGGDCAAIMSSVNYGGGGSRSNIVFRNNHAISWGFSYMDYGSGTSGGVGFTADHNRPNVPAGEFVNVANTNFRLNSSATGSIDDGLVIAGINDAGSESPYAGSAPDLGAYEYGGADWTAGSTITVPPAFPPLAETPSEPAPAAPSDAAASAVSSSQIHLAWTDNANNETGFKIERKTGAGGTWTQIAALEADTTIYPDTGLSPSTTYDYRVAATNIGGASPWSNEAVATTPALPSPPAAPSGLSAATISSSQINLGWTDNATNETGFKIERKTGAGGAWAQIVSVGPDVTNYPNTGLSASTTYYYRVAATNRGGVSPWSNETDATTQAPPPPPPPLVHYSFNDAGDIGHDDSGNGNHATASGTPLWLTTGWIGGAVAFDGVDDALADSALSSSVAQDATVACWFRLAPTHSQGGRLTDLATATGPGLQLVVDSAGKVGLDNSGGPAFEVKSPAAHADGEWHHLLAVRSGTTYAVYVDGGLAGATPGTVLSYARVYVGRRSDGTSYYGGDLDEVRVYGRVLSTEEIEALANEAPVVAARFTGWEWQPDGSLRLSATGGIDQAYVLEAAENLMVPIAWAPVTTNTATNGMVDFLDMDATSHAQRWYRTVTP